MHTIPVSPIVNMNGTSKTELLDQVRKAHEAIESAFKALQAMAPHGRDFQTAPVGAYKVARSQHNVRIGHLDDIKNELEMLWSDIHNQG